MKTVVLLSGGIDSTVALAHTHADAALSVDYGQTHHRELRAATAVASFYNVEHHILDIQLDLPCALTGHGDIPEQHAEQPDASWVPGRNLLLIAAATAWADAYHYQAVILGANADDNLGYPDCRPEFLDPLGAALTAGYRIALWKPLLRMTKKQIVELGRELEVPLDLTWSCYRSGLQPCNRCGACQSRNEAMA